MNRVRVLGFLAGALAFVALAAPASAVAGTYTWDLASNFTAAPPGANPDHDQYGATPWSYLQGPPAGGVDPSTFMPLPTFSVDSSFLATWSTSTISTPPLVGINPTMGPISALNANVQPGKVFLEPGPGSQAVAVGWASPFSRQKRVSITITPSSASQPGPCTNSTWTLEQDAAVLHSGTVAGQPYGRSAVVPPGTSIYLAVSNAGGGTCPATGLSFQVSVDATAPAVTVTSPATGSSSTISTPTFSGAAGSEFGDSSLVTLRVYPGQGASGTPVQTVNAPTSGGAWSVQPASPLPPGTYTVQAEQDNGAGDVGLSAPVTFSVHVPVVTLNPIGSKPLTTSTPTLSGTGDTDAGSDSFVVVAIYRGTTATGTPAIRVPATVGSGGQFSVQVTPALADGTYSAVAGQADRSGDLSLSAPQTFEVDAHAPPVTLLRPGQGARANRLQLVFAGAAGGAAFDSPTVAVTLYQGTTAAELLIGTVQARVTGTTWSVKWPRPLRPAVYTAVASQTDAVGHVGMTTSHTFRLIPLPPVIDGGATINRAGRVSVQIACNEPAGDTCSGTVRVVTRHEFQAVAGGPLGRLVVMFAYVHIPGGKTQRIIRTVLAPVAALLRGHASVAVTISANLRPRTGKAIHATAPHRLRRVST